MRISGMPGLLGYVLTVLRRISAPFYSALTWLCVFSYTFQLHFIALLLVLFPSLQKIRHEKNAPECTSSSVSLVVQLFAYFLGMVRMWRRMPAKGAQAHVPKTPPVPQGP